MGIYYRQVTDALIINEEIIKDQGNVFNEDIGDILSFNEELETDYDARSIQDNLYYNEDLIINAIRNLIVEDELNYKETKHAAKNIYNLVVADMFIFNEQGYRVQSLEDTLSFVEEFVCLNATPVLDTLEYSEQLSITKVYNRTVSDQLVLNEGLSGGNIGINLPEWREPECQ